ncbi:helix-turn-helix domain-containing protein [Fructilactobacillus carniphilus]|uniref:Helix-turn-helix domain-containing protein n=1 Tax=Fructilactobacillus carniphilus TaxID=2940297 RepID=A0ABY5BY67_9LACO|nr:helix-turn-helix transcriptional regulator [Fructilactobacillus carniphilus]USS91272.1 helix-turn-helix domain-containing protein [Fructilactobacillus carniphilus]
MLIFPSPQLLTELSRLVRTKRQQIHLSQAELARGICTQTTISTLENATSFSKWEIVPLLLTRLRIDPQELEKHYCQRYCYGEQQLQELESLLFQFKFKQGAQQLAHIKVENLDSRVLLSRYYCYSVFLQLMLEKNLEAAMIAFDHSLDYQTTTTNQPFIHGLAHLGEAATYQQLKFNRRAQQALIKALEQLEQQLQTKVESLLPLVRFGMAVTTLGLVLQLHAETQVACQLLINYLQQHYSYYCLADLYYLEASCFQALQQPATASHLMQRADQLVHLKNNSKLEQIYQIYQPKNS